MRFILSLWKYFCLEKWDLFFNISKCCIREMTISIQLTQFPVFHIRFDKSLARQNLPNNNWCTQCSLRYFSTNTPAAAAKSLATDTLTSRYSITVPTFLESRNNSAVKERQWTYVTPVTIPWVKHHMKMTLTLSV